MYNLLSDLSIIEASSFVASPTAGLYLAQMGAEVIRVDQIGGGLDYDRYMLTEEGRSLAWGKPQPGQEIGRAGPAQQ
ncbi:2-methylfumaryl-CoA isomerase [Alteripontixanthobacter maritimus]|uniref:2-methylfumaryl-CoA isomerase n=1 Tax=Alteripontixanthobacter maritimus TaxID=2161824 RepID=A0A369Q5S8_9SPHN|nr:CoA transferase [Alteripontixanthobacter maritimus]RDC58865.1 2-methylfumaryl-CoA isomerase [Alteripontixanthobacter maritimus]